MAEHKLKTWPESFRAVRDGRKTHEWRRDDRAYAVGDRLMLQEFNPDHGTLSGDSISVWVTFITRGPEFGVPEGWVAMSISRTPAAGDDQIVYELKVLKDKPLVEALRSLADGIVANGGTDPKVTTWLSGEPGVLLKRLSP